MPWASIIMALLSFFLSKSQGASTGKAAAIAAGVGLATYYLADPANPDNLLGFGKEAKAKAGAVSDDKGVTGTIGSVLKTGISEVGTTVRDWGPTGTLGVVAGTTAVSSLTDSKWFPWIVGGLAIFLLTR